VNPFVDGFLEYVEWHHHKWLGPRTRGMGGLA